MRAELSEALLYDPETAVVKGPFRAATETAGMERVLPGGSSGQ